MFIKFWQGREMWLYFPNRKRSN